MGAQVARDGVCLDTFVTERKHSMIKGIMSKTTCTAVFERSVLSALLFQSEGRLAKLSLSLALAEPSADSPELAAALGVPTARISKKIVRGGTPRVKEGDVVLLAALRGGIVEVCNPSRADPWAATAPPIGVGFSGGVCPRTTAWQRIA